jgi:hydrophobic/amphiphilic exporter-1 (mainly G- bacteria), HAE1 family
VVEGGRHRLRPILMTAIATIFALLPMALGLTGEGGFISQPLAIVVIGGLVSSTLLTLVLVPALYTMVENTKLKARTRREQRRARKALKRGGTTAATESPRHAAQEPDGAVPAHDPDRVPADDPARTTSGGAHEAPEGSPAGQPAHSTAEPQSGALRGYTDQFEVLKMPRRPATPPPA